jgi:hypothetical protein
MSGWELLTFLAGGVANEDGMEDGGIGDAVSAITYAFKGAHALWGGIQRFSLATVSLSVCLGLAIIGARRVNHVRAEAVAARAAEAEVKAKHKGEYVWLWCGVHILMVVVESSRLVNIRHTNTFTCTTAHQNNDTHGGAYCGVAIIIVVDVQLDLGDGGGGGGGDMNRP